MSMVYTYSATRLTAGCLLFLFVCMSCNKNQTVHSAKELKNGHVKMLQILEETRRKIDNPNNNFAAMAKIMQCDSILTTTRDPNVQLTTVVKKAVFLLEYGDETQSVSLLESATQTLETSPEGLKVVLPYLGTAYLRLAERTNCVKGHTPEACIMPVKGSGIHQQKEPAQKAVEAFERLLQLDPKQYDAIWLLNIAYMTLGQYPAKVPSKWLIPGLDKVDYVLKPFVECAAALALQVNNRAGGSIADDFDNDGFLDLVTSAWDLEDPMHYFHNNGDGTFSDWSERSGLKAIKGGLNIQQTDYNNDGFLDILVLRGAWQGQEGPTGDQPNSLLRNNGDGTFTDVTIDAGLLSFNPTQTATWNDFNRDGWVDLFIGNESQSDNSPRKCEFYINQRDGTFKNMAEAWGINISLFVKGVASGDFDNDGWPDLFISSMSGHKLLLRNTGLVDGKVVFENASGQAGFDKEMYRSFATWFFDYDNDGWLDIFVCNYEFDKPLSYYAAKEALTPSTDPAGKAFVYHNNQNGTFTNTTKAMGLKGIAFAMGANFGDVNNDGWLDIYLSTGNPSFMSLVSNKLWVNEGGKAFRDATVSSRTGSLQKGHGVSFADFDNDGDQDIHTDLGGAFRGDAYPNALFLNPGQNQNNRIYLKLEGTKSNKASIGAKITVKFRENGISRMVYRELNSGGSFGSNPLRREIGIGAATVIDEISITWPVSGITQVLTNVEPNQLLHIVEGKEGAEKLPLQVLSFKNASGMPMCAPVQ